MSLAFFPILFCLFIGVIDKFVL